MRAGRPPRLIPLGIPKTEGVEKPKQQVVPHSNVDDQTRLKLLSAFEFLPTDQEATSITPASDRGNRKHPEEATCSILPIQSNLDQTQFSSHSSSTTDHPSPLSNVDDQTRLSACEFIPRDLEATTPAPRSLPDRGHRKHSEEAAGSVLPIQSNLGQAQPLLHSSRSSDHPPPSRIHSPGQLSALFSDDYDEPLTQFVSVPTSPKSERSIDGPHDHVGMRVMQTVRSWGADKAHFRSADSQMSAIPSGARAGTGLWHPCTGWRDLA